MSFEKVREQAGHVADSLNQPKVAVPLTGLFTAIGKWSPEQWLTMLSICAVLAQLIIAAPKAYAVVKGWALGIKAAVQKVIAWFKK